MAFLKSIMLMSLFYFHVVVCIQKSFHSQPWIPVESVTRTKSEVDIPGESGARTGSEEGIL